MGRGNAGIGSAHLAAGAIGFLFVKQLRRGIDWSAWMNNLVDWLNDLFNPEKKHQRTNQKETLYYQTDRKPNEKITKGTKQRLDALLEKINQQGYQVLTDEETEFLKRASQEEL